MCEWKILFNIQVHGVALQTFYDLVQNHPDTVIIIQDDQNQIFGSYQSETWSKSNKFYGSGESFIFKFGKKQDD